MSHSEKIYITLCTLLITLGVISNIVYQKFIQLHFFSQSLELSAGALLYPFTFMITNLITEFYGKEKAHFSVTLSIIVHTVIAFILFIIDFLPATSWSNVTDTLFHQIFGIYVTAFTASILALYISRKIDIFLYTWLNRFTVRKHLGFKNIFSASVSLFLDTFIVITLMTVLGALPKDYQWILTIHSYYWKLLCTVFSTPLFYMASWTIRSLIKF